MVNQRLRQVARATYHELQAASSQSSCLCRRSVATVADPSSSKSAYHQNAQQQLYRNFSTSSKSLAKSKEKIGPRQDFNTSLSWSEEPDEDHLRYRRVTAADLVNRRTPPTKVKMQVREFIHDSLYNPHYGYFSKQAMIFTPPTGGYDFSTFSDQLAFQETIAKRYAEEYGDRVEGNLGRQVWHTPTELFSPYYAQSLVKAILQSHRTTSPDSDLVIYELGAGNGSFMLESLLFLKENHPEIFERTKYRIIEISPVLAKRQRERAREYGLRDQVQIVESDVFNWRGGDEEPCFVVALEVLDNFAHDMVRYNVETLEPLQAVVVVNPSGDFTLVYEPVTDSSLKRALSYRSSLPPTSSTSPNLSSALLKSSTLRKIFTELPFAANLSKPDFIPTKAILLLEKLREQLPKHKLLVADFDTLPDTVPGRNAPVVQTRLGRTMVPVETFLVKQGFFDIFFPTDFELLRDLYALIMTQQSQTMTIAGDPSTENNEAHSSGDFETFQKRVKVYPQSTFVREFGGKEIVKKLTTKDGAPIIDAMYGNAKVMF